MTTNPKNSTVVRAIIGLGRGLGFTALAEGVETEHQLRPLDLFGCEQAQGYLPTPSIAAAQLGAPMRRRWGAHGPALTQRQTCQ